MSSIVALSCRVKVRLLPNDHGMTIRGDLEVDFLCRMSPDFEFFFIKLWELVEPSHRFNV